MQCTARPRKGTLAVSLAIVAGLLAALGCTIELPSATLSPEDQEATMQAMIEQALTEAAPVEEPTLPEPTVPPAPPTCSGATFDAALVAAGATPSVVPAEGGDPDPWPAVPEHVLYSFQGYPLAGTFHDPAIHVFSVAEYTAVADFVPERVTALQQLLLTQPADPAQGIPFLPAWNAAQMFHAVVGYINFQNGSGVRFLTQYGQAYWAVNNHDMFYAFSGLTSGGECWISGVLPISNPVLPAEGYPPEDYSEPAIAAYYAGIVATGRTGCHV
jgi:hypothetical protein